MNEEYTFKGTLKTGTSQKGNEYTYLELKLDKDYTKNVFLDRAEIHILKKLNDNTSMFKR